MPIVEELGRQAGEDCSWQDGWAGFGDLDRYLADEGNRRQGDRAGLEQLDEPAAMMKMRIPEQA
jgi:hypothetical protein